MLCIYTWACKHKGISNKTRMNTDVIITFFVREHAFEIIHFRVNFVIVERDHAWTVVCEYHQIGK